MVGKTDMMMTQVLHNNKSTLSYCAKSPKSMYGAAAAAVAYIPGVLFGVKMCLLR
jgi:hypothetical protein